VAQRPVAQIVKQSGLPYQLHFIIR
jgi:hypothetical protein